MGEKKKKNQSIVALPGWIEAYTEFWCLACVEKALLIGFELELFTRREYEMVMYVLSIFIEQKLEILTKIQSWFALTPKLDGDQISYKNFIESLYLRAQTLLNYVYGIYIACHLENQTKQ